MQSKRIVAVHLLNDWSGSPLVFRQALEALHSAGFAIHLFTATPSGQGFLSDLTGIITHPIQYKWSLVKWITLLNYLLVQGRLFLKLLFFLRPTDQVYINTLLPFGAALAGWLRGCSVVYHVHEVSIKPRLLKSFLTAIADFTARQALFVSDYTRQQTPLKRTSCKRIYNTVSESFSKQADRISKPNTVSPFTALMLCSNKAYKGINEFVECAHHLPHIRFLLVLNTDADSVDTFVKQAEPPANCTVYPAQPETIPFYQQAHVVLNLSQPDAWVETFGMTILEAMTCGRPVITPTVGGICELIEESKEGFRISVSQKFVLVQTLRRLSSDINLYLQMAEAARRRALFFSPQTFRREIRNVFQRTEPRLASLYTMENISRIGNTLAHKPSKLAH
ncbi:glycosyltransferase family 4 protein [Spirosoma sp. KNUC1025]|uniref:glycosyltransferase family 4 protein n=1 Tax=Spirosoma sp. KNUC1025 TaxID=2894082 RepID=UPI00386EB81B|nr:glycosyltransferase family 4 protein [Spirosoma sp. KNUC1025]